MSLMHQTSDSIVSPNFELPFDIIFNILSRLSVKTLHRFKSVCKIWCTLIESPDFINKHLIESNSKNFSSVLVIDSYTNSMWLQYIDQTENHNPLRNYSFQSYPRIVGICDGLVCTILANFDSLICNPSTGRARKTSRSSLPKISSNDIFFGFAFRDNDYKLFRIVYIYNSNSKVVVRAEVYSMSTDIWSEIKVKKQVIDTHHYIKNCVSFLSLPVAKNEVFYWKAFGSNVPSLVSFDMNGYVFDMISCPDIIARLKELNEVRPVECNLIDLKGEVALACCRYDKWFDVWVLNENERSWTMKLRTENLPLQDWSLRSLGFDSKNNLVMRHSRHPASELGSNLFSYDMESHEIMYLPFVGIKEWQAVYMYQESLLSV